jgi:superfamily II DNA/RNA helicase
MIFADFGISAPVVRALSERGINAPFAIQELVIGDVLEGRDVLVQSPTGSGKTLAFGVPLVELTHKSSRGPAGLILAPTRELALQIVDEVSPLAKARQLTIAPVYGGVGLHKQAKLASRADILVATPGRLEDLLARGAVNLNRVEMLVIDEADRMLDMGFRPQVDRIVARTPSSRQTLFFSATLESAAGAVAKSYTRDPARHVHRPSGDHAPKISHRFIHLEHEAKLGALIRELGDSERTLVFVRTKRGADRLVKRLASRNLRAVAMHGNKTQAQRERALAQFTGGRVGTLVATDVAARGIDVQDIALVVNFDPPEDLDAYVHRAGRTGRASRDGCSVSFVIPDQHSAMRSIAKGLNLGDEFDHEAPTPSRKRPDSHRRHRPSGRRRSRAHRGASRGR